MPLISTRGAASAQGFGEFAQSAAVNYIENVFSTYLYTGNGSTQTITNGIDLSGKGGLVWIKARNSAENHFLFDTNRGVQKRLVSNSTADQTTLSDGLSAFNSNGFTLGSGYTANGSGLNVASWTFRKQAKFFDVVTYTGTGASRTVSHNLGSVPGCIIVKRTDTLADWQVYHRSIANTEYMVLNSTAAKDTGATRWNSTTPTSTEFSLGTDTTVNANGGTYVAYLFAHNAGGFGLSGTDNVISCGSFTAGTEVNLGWEPQWLLVKRSDGTGFWELIDNMRGFFAPPSTTTKYLLANTSDAEASWGGEYYPTATGFKAGYASGTYIYIAIRRGPMKVPTSGTSVFSPLANNNSTGTKNTTNFPVDMQINTITAGDNRYVVDRLRGVSTNATAAAYEIRTNDTASENTTNNRSLFWDNTGFQTVAYYGGATFYTALYYNFRRAPGFFDVVCYTGNGTNGTTITHNLGVAPELIIVKGRSNTWNWGVGCDFTSSQFQYLALNSGADGGTTNSYTIGAYFGGQPTTTTFTLATNVTTNQNANTYVAYLFASLAGISKVGKYTGTGTTKQIDCGFTNGARFVLIKRLGTSTDAGIGDWYVWDSARGIVSGNDPYLLLNSTAAEVTNTDYIDTYSAGFEISSTAPSAINANGGIFLFFAVA